MAVEHELDLITVAEAAQLLRVSKVTIRRWLAQGRVQLYHVGPRAVRLRRGDLLSIVTPVAPSVSVAAGTTDDAGVALQLPRLTQKQVERGWAAVERARKHMAEMRAARGGQPLGESWPIIRAAREDPSRHW